MGARRFVDGVPQSTHPLFVIWRGMHRRCSDPTDANYKYYGQRGVRVCARWGNLAAFVADMGPRPAGRSIERIDNGGIYEPKNCRWATRTEQAQNRRTTQMVVFRGRKMSLSDWARAFDSTEALVRSRLRSGWSLDAALTTPVQARGARRRGKSVMAERATARPAQLSLKERAA